MYLNLSAIAKMPYILDGVMQYPSVYSKFIFKRAFALYLSEEQLVRVFSELRFDLWDVKNAIDNIGSYKSGLVGIWVSEEHGVEVEIYTSKDVNLCEETVRIERIP